MQMNEAICRIVTDALNSHLDELLDSLEYTTDTSDFICVDGEEGDYGITRYLHEGKCFLVNFNFAGDWEENILTSYGVELFVSSLFKVNVELEIPTIDGEDRKALLKYFGNTKADSIEGQIGAYRNSPHLDQASKDEMTGYLNSLRNLGEEVK